MTIPLLLLFVAVCCFLLCAGMWRRGAIYEFPFLAGAVFAGFALPQFIGLATDPFLPPGALEKTLVMSILCASMCWIGYVANSGPLRAFNWDYDDRRLLNVSIALSLTGCYFYYKFSQIPEDILKSSQLSGLPVAYLFFARLLSYGFAIAVLLYAKNRSKAALAVALFGSAFYLERIVIAGRRAELIEFCVIIALAVWFHRGRCVPRGLMLGGLIFGVLLVNSTGEYRTATMSDEGPRWDAVLQIDFLGNLENLTKQGGVELMNAVYYIEATDRTMTFDFGLTHWNQLVYRFVPAQLVGSDLKEALILTVDTSAQGEFRYTPVTGSTLTGMTDTFQSFWYFGCLEFGIIAFVLSRLWQAACLGSFTAQLAYVLVFAQALESITHSTDNFIAPWIHMGVFLIPALMFARRHPSEDGLAALPIDPSIPHRTSRAWARSMIANSRT